MDFLNGKVCGNDEEKKIPADIFPLYGNVGSLSLPSPGAALKIVTTMQDLYFFPNTILIQTS